MELNNMQKLHELMLDNNLKLTLAEFIEYAYHQWAEEYLTVERANEHINNSLNKPWEEPTLPKLEGFIELGRELYRDRVGVS